MNKCDVCGRGCYSLHPDWHPDDCPTEEELNVKNGCTFYAVCGNSASAMCTNERGFMSYRDCGSYRRRVKS
jgi:hypothetical protein